jgi:large subunit ribosomal protein L10
VDRSQKEELVASMHDAFEGAASVIVTHYTGLTVAEVTDLRAQMREAGASFKVTKNRLTRLALKDTPYEGISDLFTGPTAMAYSADPVAPAKVAVNFAKKNEKLVVIGGAMGETALDADAVKSLAAMPSLDELRAKIAGMLTQPAAKIASVLSAPGGQVARVISAKSEQGEAA